MLYYLGMLVHLMTWDKFHTYQEGKGYVGAFTPNVHHVWIVDQLVGQYAKIYRAGGQRGQWVNVKRLMAVPTDRMAWAMSVYAQEIRAIESQKVYDAENAKRRDVAALSQNTVTRALVHAHDNGYCNETVIALISAGHKMPQIDVTVRVSVEIPIHIDGKEDYYIARAMFGRTRGDLGSLVGTNLGRTEGADALQNMIADKLSEVGASIAWSDDRIVITEIEAEFPHPVIRPIEDVIESEPATAHDDRF